MVRAPAEPSIRAKFAALGRLELAAPENRVRLSTHASIDRQAASETTDEAPDPVAALISMGGSSGIQAYGCTELLDFGRDRSKYAGRASPGI